MAKLVFGVEEEKSPRGMNERLQKIGEELMSGGKIDKNKMISYLSSAKSEVDKISHSLSSFFENVVILPKERLRKTMEEIAELKEKVRDIEDDRLEATCLENVILALETALRDRPESVNAENVERLIAAMKNTSASSPDSLLLAAGWKW